MLLGHTEGKQYNNIPVYPSYYPCVSKIQILKNIVLLQPFNYNLDGLSLLKVGLFRGIFLFEIQHFQREVFRSNDSKHTIN